MYARSVCNFNRSTISAIYNIQQHMRPSLIYKRKRTNVGVCAWPTISITKGVYVYIILTRALLLTLSELTHSLFNPQQPDPTQDSLDQLSLHRTDRLVNVPRRWSTLPLRSTLGHGICML